MLPGDLHRMNARTGIEIRRRTLIALLLAATLLSTPLFAGPQEGVMSEFRKVEEDIRNARKTPEARKATLEANLLRAMRLAIARRFHPEKQGILKDLTAESLAYENPTSDRVYYVKFKTYIVRFDFSRDPEERIQAPTYEKFLIIGGEQGVHSEDAATDRQ